MITTINAKQLAILYKMSYSTFQQYLSGHREQLRSLGTKRVSKDGKIVISQNYNSEQLQYIINTILGDSPEDYVFNGKVLVKQSDV